MLKNHQIFTGRMPIFLIALFLIAFWGTGCSSLVKKATTPLIESLSKSVNKQNDIELVRDGAPAFLLMIDGFVESSPDDPDTLMAAADLYSAYNTAFVAGTNRDRAKILSTKAKDYAFAAVAIENKVFAALHDAPYSQFVPVIATFGPGDEELLWMVISTWAGFIQAHTESTDNLADIAKVQALALRLLEIDETYYYGSGHIAMGILYTLLPAQLGGKPEQAKDHFAKAIEISEGKFLPVYVLFAEKYARIVFDRKLHDSLLTIALETPADIVPELTLINSVAKKQAADLLADGDDYF
jgi:hypothetical protein